MLAAAAMTKCPMTVLCKIRVGPSNFHGRQHGLQGLVAYVHVEVTGHNPSDYWSKASTAIP